MRSPIHFSLGRCCVLVLALGGLLALNIKGGADFDGMTHISGHLFYGWPYPIYYHTEVKFVGPDEGGNSPEQRSSVVVGSERTPREYVAVGPAQDLFDGNFRLYGCLFDLGLVALLSFWVLFIPLHKSPDQDALPLRGA